MIDKTIKNLKKYFIRFSREYLQQKYQKNTLKGFGGNTYNKNSKIQKKNFLFVFPIYKRVKYKNGCYYQRNI